MRTQNIEISLLFQPVKFYSYRSAHLKDYMLAISGDEAFELVSELANSMGVQMDNHIVFKVEKRFGNDNDVFYIQWSDSKIMIGKDIIEKRW